MFNRSFNLLFLHIRTELGACRPSAGPRSAEDRAGRDAAGNSGSDITLIQERSLE